MTFNNNTFFKLATGGVYTSVCIHNCVLVQIYTSYTELFMHCGIVYATNPSQTIKYIFIFTTFLHG